MRKVSLIIPCRNEEKFIAKVLDNILEQDYPQELIEVLIADGMSEDKTLEIINSYKKKHANIIVLINPQKIVPLALNAAIKKSSGEVIIRLDAHSEYPINYVSELVKQLYELDADNVGGVWETTPANESMIAESIAAAMSSSFGIGNAQYRLANDKIRKVDTVPFGCYKREIFDKIGLFDEELVRNQDDEFNGRLIKNGGKIYLIPDLKITYYARDSITKMIKMFYQYAYYKPLVNKKLGAPASLRQFAPPLFVLFFLITGLGGFMSPLMLLLFLFGAAVYLFADIWEAFGIGIEKDKARLTNILIFLFPLIHFSYGIGYLKGIFDFVILNKKSVIKEINR